MLELLVASALSAFVLYKIVKFAFADADSALLSKGDHKPKAFQGKVVWCTGASQGLGLILVKHFAEHGARIIISSRNAKRLEVQMQNVTQND
jgi:dehydrogenase/reductase SDR family protein 7